MKRRPKVPKSTRRVIGYCRVSTDEQAEHGISLDAQEGKHHTYADLHELQLVEVIRDNATGKTLNRPGLQRALRMLREDEADAILVTRLDRLVRVVTLWGSLVEGYFHEGTPWSLLSVFDHVDTSTATGRFILNVQMSVNQWERETIAERTRDALAHLAAQGVILGGAPLGLAREASEEAPEAGRRKSRLRVVEVPGELAIVRRIRTLRSMGHTVRDIAELLAEENVPTKRGGKWHATTVQRIIHRKIA